ATTRRCDSFGRRPPSSASGSLVYTSTSVPFALIFPCIRVASWVPSCAVAADGSTSENDRTMSRKADDMSGAGGGGAVGLVVARCYSDRSVELPRGAWCIRADIPRDLHRHVDEVVVDDGAASRQI